MIRDHLRGLLEEALSALRRERILAPGKIVPIQLDRPARAEHGDFSSNLALELAGQSGIPPRQLATRIAESLPASEFVSRVEVAGPGFINFFLTRRWLHDTVREIARQRESYGRSNVGAGRRVNVEYGSVGPTGPITVGSGRNVALGDSVANLLEAVGYSVSREWLINDVGNQIDKLAGSLEARYLQALGHDTQLPEDAYPGNYLIELGKRLAEEEGMGLIGKTEEIGRWGVERIVEWHRASMERFSSKFDTWFWESSLHESGKVAAALDRLGQMGHTYESEGALWFRSSELGTAGDRPLLKSDDKRTPTYLAADVAYLLDKLERGYDHCLYIWGADHHGQVDDLYAAARALGVEENIEIIVYQLVNLLEGGRPVRVSKRTGDIVTLDELVDEVGVDAARFTLLSRSFNAPMDFDLELVSAQSQENPVYYVQYAHTRICGVERHGRERGVRMAPIEEVDLSPLQSDSEAELMRKLAEYPEQVEVAANLRAPYRLTVYSQDVAAAFHAFYRDHRVISEDAALTQARLWLAEAARQVLANTLSVLGVSAPERM